MSEQTRLTSPAATTALCSRCVLPSSFPNIRFDERGVCSFCTAAAPQHQAAFDERQRAEFEKLVDTARGRHGYDALCCYSGGKDSTYMLQMMSQQLRLSTLAFTLDNGYITEQSKANILKVVDHLEIDHLFVRPQRTFMQRMYRSSIFGDLNKTRGNYQTRISDVCLSCIAVVNTTAARLALQHRIPLVFAGFTPGQVPRAVIRNQDRFYRDTYAEHRGHFLERLGPLADRYLGLPESDFTIYQMSPYLVYEKSEAEILEAIRELGWKHPEQLDGCTSNCALNAVGNICHERKYGFHPYALELSKLIRKQLLSREEALEKLSLAVEDQVVSATLVQLGVTASDIEQLDRER